MLHHHVNFQPSGDCMDNSLGRKINFVPFHMMNGLWKKSWIQSPGLTGEKTEREK
jgi:hypothetical protein